MLLKVADMLLYNKAATCRFWARASVQLEAMIKEGIIRLLHEKISTKTRHTTEHKQYEHTQHEHSQHEHTQHEHTQSEHKQNEQTQHKHKQQLIAFCEEQQKLFEEKLNNIQQQYTSTKENQPSPTSTLFPKGLLRVLKMGDQKMTQVGKCPRY